MTNPRFPNLAGDHPENDSIVLAELKMAGIDIQGDPDDPKFSDALREIFREQSGEVKTCVFGSLHKWTFKRGWRYWICNGPGLSVEVAEEIYNKYKNECRVGGHAGGPHPREFYHGLGVGFYHVDTAEALKALAGAIKEMVSRNAEILNARHQA